MNLLQNKWESRRIEHSFLRENRIGHHDTEIKI